MKILAIETSCDETSAAVIEGTSLDLPITTLSNVVASSLQLHQKTGGVVPEVAAREQLTSLLPVVKKGLSDANTSPHEIDALAVTRGPGLIGSLLVGTETAKILALAWEKPLVPVNHLFGHLFANWLDASQVPQFPFLGVVVSGGHTDLVFFESSNNYRWIGGTLDDAAGECFDKCARLIFNAPYPGGPHISQEAALISTPLKPFLPRPMLHQGGLNMSFSGLKTAVLNAIRSGKYTDVLAKRALAYDLERSIVEVLIQKIKTAILTFHPTSLLLGGGVVANHHFREQLTILSSNFDLPLFCPPISLCGDNAAMIGAAALANQSVIDPVFLSADPGLAF